MKTFCKENQSNIIYTIALIFGIILLLTVGLPFLHNPKTYTLIIQILDEKKSNVLKLLTASSSASVLITAIPGDTATPIATKVADLSSVFLLILTILYLEKYLLTIIGTFACITICLGFILLIISIWKQKVSKKTGIKLIVCAVISLTIIPVSTLITHTIDQTYETSIQETIDNAVSSSKEEFIDEQTESKNVWDQIAYGFSQIVDTISSSASKAYEWAQNALNNFIEATAVMLVTSCLIPMITFLIAVWLAKILIERITDRPIEINSQIIPSLKKKRFFRLENLFDL